MDPPASAFSRAGRTFWTVWNYFTEVVGRYLTPEPINNGTSSRQEATAAQQTEDHGDGAKNELKETVVTFETGSEVKKPRPAVAWEQCNVLIGPSPSRENVQYTGKSNRGGDSKASQDGDDIKQEQVDRTENKDTIQHVTKEELNMGKGVQSVVVTGIQILFSEPTSERSNGQGAQGHTDSYSCAEANRLRGAVAARKEEEEEEIPEEVTEEFPCGEEGTKTEEHENDRDGEIHFDIESPNLTSACAEPVTLLDKNGDKENTDRLMKHDVLSTEDETMVRLNEKDGEEETAVLFMETDKEGWKVAEIVEFSAGGENSDDLCAIKDQMSRDGNEVKNDIDMEELRRVEEREEENRAIEEMDRREQEEILDRGFGPYNDFQVSENNNEHEYGDNRLKFDEGTIEKLDQENDPNLRLSDEDRTLGRGQDITVSEAELELQIAYDKRVFVSNDEITIVSDEQRMECNIERIDSTVLEERKEKVSEDGSKVIEDGGSNKIEDVVINIGTDTEAEDVKDKVTGLDTFFYQERNVVVEKNKLEEEKISKEDEDPLNEVEGKLISVVDNRVEIRGVAKCISPGLCEDLVVAQEPKRVACEETQEEIPEINNGKELDKNTAPKILEVVDNEVNPTHLQEVHTDSDTKELERVENIGTSLKSDNSPVSELMEGREDLKTVEGLFESEDIEKASDTVVDEHTVEKAAKSLWETERTDSVLLNETDTQILEDLVKTKAESHEPMEIELGLSEEAAETDVCLSDETLKTEAEFYKETEEIKAEFREGWMESKAEETVGTEFESVKETQAEIPEVRTGVVPSEDKDETESGSMQESADTDFGLLRETVEEVLQKGAEVDTPDVRTVTVLSMETNTEELVESEAWDMLETESGLVKKHEAEIPDVRTETASSERTVTTEAGLSRNMTLYPSSIHTEAVFLTETKAVLSNESLETDNGLSDKSSEAGTKLQGMVEAGLPDSTEIEAKLFEAMVCAEVVLSQDTEDELSENKYSIKATLMEELVEPGTGETLETEKGIMNETDAEILDMRIEESPSEETESGIVDTEARLSLETTAIESELLEELPETESGSQKDKETKRQRIETKPSVETDVEELVESEAENTVETEVGLVRTVAELPEEVRPKIELFEKTNRTGADSSEDTDETEARFSEEIETELVETKNGLQKNIEEDILHVRTETVLSVETVEMDTDSSDKSLESRSLEISEAGLSEESVDSEAGLKDIYTEISEAGLSEELVDSEAGLKDIYTEIPDVEKESGLSEETVDAGLSEKTDVSDAELVKNTKALIMLEAELSDVTEAVLKEKAEDNTANKSLEIEVGLFWETNETEALVTEEVVKTGPGLSKQTDFGSQGQSLEIEESQVGWSGETVETDSVLLNETDTQILEDLVKTKAESHEPMEIELGLSEEAAETDVCLSDETLKTEAGLYKETEEIKAEFREGWMESKAEETVGTEFESVKETQAEIPEVRTGVVSSEDKDETESGSMQESADTDFGLLRETVEEVLQKGAEVDTPDVRTVTVLSMETNTEELVESEAWDMLETESGLVKKHEAEIPDVRTETASSERTVTTEAGLSRNMTLYPSSIHTEAVFLTETKAVLSNESLETDNGLSDKSSEAGTKLQGMVEAGLPDSTEIEAELFEAMVCGEVVLSQDTEDELSEKKYSIKATLMKELVEPGTGETLETEKGIMNETDAGILDMRIEESPSEETESGIVDTEARFVLETTAIETESGSQKDKETKRQRIETKPSVETDVEELVESEAENTVETEVGLVRTVAELPEEVRPKIELFEKTNRTGADSSEDTDETEARFSEEIETELVETKNGLQKNIEEDILHVRTETVLSVETVEMDTDSSDKSLESRSLEISEAGLSEESVDSEAGLKDIYTEISEAGLSEESVDSEAGLKDIYTEIPDVEKESGLSEETVDAGLSEKTDVLDAELVKNTKALIMLEAELSDATEAVLKEKAEDNTANKSLEIEVGLFGETDETEALVTEEVVKTGPGLSKQTDFGSQGQSLEIEDRIIEKFQVGWSGETVETDAGLPEENRGEGAKAGFRSPSGTKNGDQNLQLQFDASALDFTAQKSRIALKNPHARPPRDPRTLLQMPSLTPSPSKPTVHVPIRGPTGIPMRGMGGIGIKLPGLGAGPPILRKTGKGVRGENNTENILQKSEIEQDVKEESPMKEETQNKQEERKTKWTPPRHPGFGNPLMMNELKNKLKKTTKESGDD